MEKVGAVVIHKFSVHDPRSVERCLGSSEKG